MSTISDVTQKNYGLHPAQVNAIQQIIQDYDLANKSNFPRNTNRRRALAVGNSVLTAGVVGGRNIDSGYSNRDVPHWVNACAERPWVKITERGKDGDATRASANGEGILARMKSNLDSGEYDDVLLIGWEHNQYPLGISATDTINDIDEMCRLTWNYQKRFFIFTDAFMDAFGDDPLRKAHYFATLAGVLALQTKWSHVIIIPVHESFNRKLNSATTDGKSFSNDRTHPTAVASVRGAYPAFKKATAGILTPSPLPTYLNDDPYSISWNPFVTGSNANGGAGAGDNYFWRQGGALASGPGPNAMVIGTPTGAGIPASNAIVSSKVAHPVDTGWGYNEASAPCWKLVMTTNSSGPGVFIISARDMVTNYTWSSGGAVANPFRYVRPTVANGCLYRIVGDGNLSTGSDPTGSWSTNLGEIFASGTAQLQVCKAWNDGTGRAYAVLDMYVDQAVTTGFWSYEVVCGFFNSGNTNATLNGSSGAFPNAILPNAYGTAASFGSDGSNSGFPSHVVTHTQYDPAVFIPAYNGVTGADYHKCYATFYLAPSTTVSVTIAHLGSHLLRNTAIGF